MIMSQEFKSLNLSLVFHAALVVGISFLIKTKEGNEGLVSKKYITMRLGSIGNSRPGVGELPKTSRAKSEKRAIESFKVPEKSTSESYSNKTSTHSAGNTSAVESTGGSNGGGTATESGQGSGGSQDFNSSIQTYNEPVYPKMALRRGIEGSLRVKIKINSQGMPVETFVLKSSGFDLLDQSATNAIKTWVFMKRAGSDFYFVEKTIIFQITK